MKKNVITIAIFFWGTITLCYSQNNKKIDVILSDICIDSFEINFCATIQLNDSVSFKEYLGNGYTLNCDNWFSNHLFIIEKYNKFNNSYENVACFRDMDLFYLADDSASFEKIDKYGKGLMYKTIAIPLKYMNIGTYRFTIKQYYFQNENESKFEFSNKKIVVLNKKDFRWVKFHSNR